MTDRSHSFPKKQSGLTPYEGKAPFVFVSYSHNEVVKVEGILRFLQRAGIRFWYDKMGAGIPAGYDWKRWIINRFENCAMFLCFLANGSEQRREVLDEITMAIERHEKDEKFQVVFIFLEKMPARVFERVGYPKIEAYIQKAQYILYKGITDSFLEQLYAKNVFADDLVEEEYLGKWRARSTRNIEQEVRDALEDNPYICETFFPEKKDGENFYRVRMDQIDPDAVCLICLDNQWCPPDFYDNPSFWKEGFLTEEAVRLQGDYQEKEIFRALLHHRQLIVNRAYFYNSLVFSRFYDNKGGDYEAFCSLLADGSLLVYLTDEEEPYDKSRRPHFSTVNYDIWGEVCQGTEVFCLRLDWTDAVSNRRKVEELLYQRFQDFCLTAVENKYLMNDLAVAFGLDEHQKDAFKKIWRDVQLYAAARDRDEHPSYNRERFYKQFLVKRNTDVSDCILDIRKAFVPELKETVDFQYGLNLPVALGVQPLYPPMGHLKDFYRSGQNLQRSTRELTIEELSCAVGQFEPDFLLDMVDFPHVQELSLDEIVLLREMDEWKDYIRTVSNGRKRAHLQEVDFYDVSYVWERFYAWMARARKTTESGGRIQWESISGAISIIYRLGSYEIITVYHADSKEVDIRSTLESANEIPEGQNHTIFITIDYVCADLLADSDLTFDLESNFLLAELRLFEGMSKESLSVVFDGLMNCLTAMKHRIIPVDKEEIRRKDHLQEKRDSLEWREYIEKIQEEGTEWYQSQRYNRKKRNSSEWLWYLELKENRPEEFQSDDHMLQIVTDLERICQYELEHENAQVGVRYKSPYSMLVVDLVRNREGKEFLYERILPTVPKGAVVCIPVFEGKYVLLEQFRHAMRTYQLAFPRGYAEKGLPGEQNVRKELEEELGVNVRSVQFLGTIVADSGISGNQVEAYVCDVSRPQIKAGYEGIRKVVILSSQELHQKLLDGEITDGYTLAGLELLEKGIN